MNFYAANLCALFTPAPEHQILLSELFDFLDKNQPTQLLGRNARFERNRAACDEDIFHIHFCFPSEVNPQWLQKDIYYRTSDNFIIYTKHWRFDKLCCVLAVITPEAHQRIDGLLPKLIQEAQYFNGLGKDDLLELTWFKP